MGRFVRVIVVLACAGLLAPLAACTSRTLPLPPPTIDSVVAPNDQGLALLKGTAQEGAAIGVMNDATLTGVIVTSPKMGCNRSCPFEALVQARSGDHLRVWQFFETPGGVDPEPEVPK